MAIIPLTSHERELIKEIEKEVNEMSQKASDLFDAADKAKSEKEAEDLFKQGMNQSKGIRERSKVRAGILRTALFRVRGF